MKPELNLLDLLPQDSSKLAVCDHEEFPLADLPEVPPGKEPTAQFVENIQRFGVIYPLVVIRAGGRLVVKDGLRRLQALRRLGRTTGRVRVVDLDASRGNVLGLALNEQRSENPIAELRMILELVQGGANEETIAAATGMSRTRIRRRMRLTRLSKEWREIADRGGVKASVAEQLSKLPSPDQKRALRRFRREGKLQHPDLKKIRQAGAAKVVASLGVELFTSPAPLGWEGLVRQKVEEAISKAPDGHPVKEMLISALAALPAPAAAAA